MSNPGISNRLRASKEHAIDRQTEGLDPENMDHDFMEFEKMFTSYKSKIENQEEKNQLQIVQRKYFKRSTQFNFLTWSEKEQIRYLHDTDAVGWSAEKLAECFPAPATVIKKVIKSRWKPDDASQIDRHDKSVHKTWQLFREGKLEIDPDLKTHLAQFGNREKTMPSVPNKSVDLIHNQCNTNSNGEFSNIIQSYKKSTTNNTVMETKSVAVLSDRPSRHNTSNHSRVPSDETYTLDGSRHTKSDPHFTLGQYRETFNSPPKADYVQAETIVPKNTSMTINYREDKHAQHKINESRSVTKGFIPERLQNADYLEKITIPKNKFKEGGTYKVGDCYYDDDGEFLYRVPGMT